MDYYLSGFAALFDGITTNAPSTGAIIALILSFLLLICSAFVSGSEIAFFSLAPADMNELEEERTANDRRILALLADSERLLATILCSNNFVNVAIILLLNYFFLGGDNPVIAFGDNTVMEFLFMTVLLTFLLLLFGEVMPKIAASQKRLAMARLCAPAYGVLVKLWWPVSWLLLKSGRVTDHIKSTQQLSVDDLEQALELTDKKEIADEQQMLKGIIRFGGEMAREVMTPRVDIVDLDVRTPFPEVIKCIVENNYSRIPVFAGTEDHITGILYIKDLLPHLNKPANFRWQTLVRPATFVPETKMIDDLLRDFQAAKVHIAIVVDEFGGTSGLVTMEDIIEEIVGEINDEYDDDERTFTRLNQNTFVFEAKTLLTDFRRIMQLPDDAFDDVAADADTLAGLVLELKGEFPTEHERIQHGRFTFEIMEMDERRIVKIKVIVKPLKTQDNTDEKG
ncbi:MAG: gliding motility-associated protein GldE [Bacteroidaceae bacterium]|nr:gliding motility-associated protein GldE [Bacteroidaceae bacterium]